MRLEVAEHPNAPAEALATLGDDGDQRVRVRVASNPATPAVALVTLAGDEKLSVREAVARNQATPGETLVMLADDEQEALRTGARETITARICDTLGVAPENTDAIDLLRDQAWWTMAPDDPAVVVTLALAPNA